MRERKKVSKIWKRITVLLLVSAMLLPSIPGPGSIAADNTIDVVEEGVNIEEGTGEEILEGEPEQAEEPELVSDPEQIAEPEAQTPQILEYEDGAMKVTATAEAGIIPADAVLQVVPVVQEYQETLGQYQELEGKLQEKAAAEGYTVTGFLAYDITFVNAEGQQIEPSGDVTIAMEYSQAAIPASVWEAQTENNNVSLMYLQRYEDGQADIIDMGQLENSPLRALDLIAENQIAGAEFIDRAASLYTFVWSGTEIEEASVEEEYDEPSIDEPDTQEPLEFLPMTGQIEITAEDVNLHTEPSVDAETVAVVPAGTKLELLGMAETETEIWYQAIYEEAEVYVRGDMAQIVEDKDSEEEPEDPVETPKVMTFENDDVIITVSADADGIIPENSQLRVVPILPNDNETKDQYKEVEDQLNKKAENEEYDIAGFLAYDISFVNENGEKVEPNGDVKVTMEYKNEVLPEEVKTEEEEALDVTVMHLEENSKGEVKEVVDMVADTTKEAAVETTEDVKIKKAEFITDSFSVYTITWTRSWGTTMTINFNYVDELGEPILGLSGDRDKTGNDTIDLTTAEYRVEIPGYTYKTTTIDRFNNNIAVNSITRNRNTITYNNSVPWSGSGNNTYNVYFVYEKNSDISIEDKMLEDGSLTAESSLGNITKYTWLRSDSEDGEYTEVERVEYQGDVSNISQDGKKLYPTYDEGARKWYKVSATLEDGTVKTSEPHQVAYYSSLQNGSFEIPQIASGDRSTHVQLSNADYKNRGGVWQTTGTRNGQDIEIIRAMNGGIESEKTAYAWNGMMEAVDENQFAELNCEAAGALYQDVLTYSGQSLNWWLSHRARGVSRNNTSEYDTMYLVIMPTSIAMTAGDNNSELDTQPELRKYLSNKGIDIDKSYSRVGDDKLNAGSEDGVYVYRVTSDDQSWHSVRKVEDYVAKASLTRFFFVAGDTASKNNTVGNFLDAVDFSQKLPPVNDNEFSMEILKKFSGLDGAGLEEVKNHIEFQISATDKVGKELSEEEIISLFGVSTISGVDMSVRVDGSLYHTIANKTISNNAEYTVTIKEINADLSGYEMTSTAKTTVTHDGVSKDPTENAVIESLRGKTTATVEFTNSYERAEIKNVNFQKVWDDNNNAFNTRPASLDVTLKASIIVEEDGSTVEKFLDEYTQTATLTANSGWKTTWKVPVYHEYNGTKVKINYTVEEGAVNSDYVYESPSNGVAQQGTGEAHPYTDFSGVTNESDTQQPNIRNRMAGISTFGALNASMARAAGDSSDAGLGKPAHNKYIDYNRNTGDYTLNLDVTGKKGEAKGADILFVIDTSGSMSGNNGLLAQLKNLLIRSNTGIIDKIFATEGNVNSVAYVSFAGVNETRVSPWYQATQKTTLKNSIDGLKATGGTNWTYAMQQASTLMGQKEDSENEKVVIFLSDGKPTYTMEWSSRYNRYVQDGDGSDTENSYYTDAANVVNSSTHLSNSKMYSVYLTNNTQSGMKTFSDKVSNSELVNGTKLTEALEGILNKVIPTYENVVITDTLSENVVFAESNPTITVTKRTAAGRVSTLSRNEYTATVGSGTVRVALLDGASLEDGATYTVSFKVKPSDIANEKYSNNNGQYTDVGGAGTGSTSADRPGFYSNVDAQTTVTYEVNKEAGSATYPMPVVQVTTHELNYEKVWKYPSSVSAPTDNVELNVRYTDGTSNTITLTKENGYRFKETVPVTKNISSITETPIEGYTPSYQITDGGTNAVVTNSYSKVTTNTIHVEKIWIGGTTHNPITVGLWQSANGADARLYKTVVLSDENNWEHTWSKLPESEGSAEDLVTYTYAVREERTPANYSSNIVYDYVNGRTNVTITNTYDPNCEDENYYIANVLQTEKITLEKAWNDENDTLQHRPQSLAINVMDGKGNTLTFNLNSIGSWKKTVTLLQKVGVTYTAEEELGDASQFYEQESAYTTTTNDGTTFSFVNKLKTTSIVVHKVWNDGDMETRPETISFKLEYRENSTSTWKEYLTSSMTAEDMVDDEPWTKQIGNLPATYEYRITETNVAAGYNTKVADAEGRYIITNTLNWKVIKTSTPIGDKEAEPLAGAEFELKSSSGVIATGISGADGAIQWTPGEGVDLTELDGEYTIHETKAPNGYVLSGDWTLTFTNGLLVSATLDGEEVAYTSNAKDGVVISITNNELYELPDTGGSGIFWYMFGGMLLMMAAALILYINRCRGVLKS